MNPRILILTDGQGWVVDRIARHYHELIPFAIDIDYYTKLSNEELLEKAKSYDIIHFNNADVGRHLPFIEGRFKPTIISVRSFRFKEPMLEASRYATAIHVIHPELKNFFQNARFISDAVDDIFQPKEFVVGMAFQDEPWNYDYKGVNLVEQACEELGVTFKKGTNLKLEEMSAWYDSIDLYVCASKKEGFGTPVMECLMRNKPVISTDTGMGQYTNIFKIERSVESIKEGILMYYTYPQVEKFRWGIVCNAMAELYMEVFNNANKV